MELNDNERKILIGIKSLIPDAYIKSIAGQVNMAEATVSGYLKGLAGKGLVKEENKKPFKYYILTEEGEECI